MPVRFDLTSGHLGLVLLLGQAGVFCVAGVLVLACSLLRIEVFVAALELGLGFLCVLYIRKIGFFAAEFVLFGEQGIVLGRRWNVGVLMV